MPSVTETAPWRTVPDGSAAATATASPAVPAAPQQAMTPLAAVPATSTAVTPPQPPVAPAVTPPQPPVAAAVALSPAPAVVAPAPAMAPAAPARPPAPAAAHPAPIAAPPQASAATAEDLRTIVRAAMGESLVPVQQAFREIHRRIDELERRPAAVAPAPAASSPAAVAPPYRPPQATLPGASIAPIPVTLGSLAPGPVSLTPRAPILDVAAIERDASVTIDGAIDGRRRKVRLAITFVLLLLVVFGGLFAALAYSYQPHNSRLDAPAPSGEILA
jgi:hypothetical protein